VSVCVTVAERDTSLRVYRDDDGAGFDPDAVRAGTGLTNMRDRVAAVGGHVTIESTPRHGTRISATIPLTGPLR
jgi:signal transduction histidine kinase